MLPMSFENPRVSAWLMACRSTAWLAASRTRRSAHGDFGSVHWSGNTSQNVHGRVGRHQREPGRAS